MANFNKVMLMGNMTRDPQVSIIPSTQNQVCDFGLAVNRTWTGPDGIKKEETTFVDCTCFGKTAEILAKYKKKGDPLFVEGRLKLDQWEKDGIKHSKMRVIVENFQFLNRGQPGGYGGGQGGYAPGAPAADPGEYAGEPQAAPAPQQRPAYRAPAGRPVAQPRPAPAPQQPAPNYDAGDVPSVPADDAPQISSEDIPF
jgi:single-strand DNA-binding protein